MVDLKASYSATQTDKQARHKTQRKPDF